MRCHLNILEFLIFVTEGISQVPLIHFSDVNEVESTYAALQDRATFDGNGEDLDARANAARLLSRLSTRRRTLSTPGTNGWFWVRGTGAQDRRLQFAEVSDRCPRRIGWAAGA
jgi:hypothetical protein